MARVTLPGCCHPRESGDPVVGPRRAGAKRETLRQRRDPANPDARVASWILAFARMTTGGSAT
jgi:hypothetical protein